MLNSQSRNQSQKTFFSQQFYIPKNKNQIYKKYNKSEMEVPIDIMISKVLSINIYFKDILERINNRA